MNMSTAASADRRFERGASLRPSRRLALTNLGVALIVLIVSGLAASQGLWKVLTVSWVSLASMLVGAAVGALVSPGTRGLVWGYGLASGAMLTSAALDLVPLAVRLDAEFAGLGIAAGFILGYTLDMASRSSRRTNLVDTVTLRLTTHSVTAGAVIGTVYALLPSLGLLLGLSIVSHKGPAGYAAARRLTGEGRSPAVLLVPAAGFGIPAMVMSLLDPGLPMSANAFVFGLSAGVFLHFTLDFLPQTTMATRSADTGALTHYPGPRPRTGTHGVVSTIVGATVIAVLWFLLA